MMALHVSRIPEAFDGKCSALNFLISQNGSRGIGFARGVGLRFVNIPQRPPSNINLDPPYYPDVWSCDEHDICQPLESVVVFRIGDAHRILHGARCRGYAC